MCGFVYARTQTIAKGSDYVYKVLYINTVLCCGGINEN
nr:MAG TPA: hypothetical protein [Caudoviricetes sp.]